jgi:zinc D-Ala-D-Ala carboxypeptidase
VRLTEHFTLDEFEHSQTASRIGIDNRVPPDLMPNVQRLAEALEMVRALLGHPIMISSGYRCAHLNRLVGGTPGSHHLLGAAADFTCRGFGSPLAVCRAVEPHMEGFGLAQIIHEYGAWTHCSIFPPKPGNGVLTIDRQGARIGLHTARQ